MTTRKKFEYVDRDPTAEELYAEFAIEMRDRVKVLRARLAERDRELEQARARCAVLERRLARTSPGRSNVIAIRKAG